MKKLIGIILLSISIAACSTIRNPISINQLTVVESSYGVALSIAVAYRNTRLCKKDEVPSINNICAQRSVILKLQAADRNAQLALNNARSFIKNNPTLDAFSVIQIAQNAVDGFKLIQQQYGVQ